MENEKLYPLNTGGAEGIFAEDGSLESVNKLEGEVTYRTGVTTSQAFKHALEEAGQEVAYFATPNTLRQVFEELRGEGELKYGHVVNGLVASEVVNAEEAAVVLDEFIEPEDSIEGNEPETEETDTLVEE